jgi:hypothetical protein
MTRPMPGLALRDYSRSRSCISAITRGRPCFLGWSAVDEIAGPTEAQLRRGEAATWGDPRPATRMRLLAWKPLTKNSLRGFASVELPNKLCIIDIPVLISRGNAWVTLPSKPQIDSEGRHKRDPNGQSACIKILEWRDRDLSTGFSDAVVALVSAAHPDALDDDN